jgi:hypothetical protein
MFGGQLETATASSRPHERSEEHEPPAEMPLLAGLPFMFRGDAPTPRVEATLTQQFDLRALAPQSDDSLNGRITGPVRLLQEVTKAWSLNPSELMNLLAYPSEGLVCGLLDGRITFWPESDRGDRLRLMYFIHSTLADLFVNPADECRWMRTRLADLDDLSPVEYMLQKRIPGMVALRAFVEQRLANR